LPTKYCNLLLKSLVLESGRRGLGDHYDINPCESVAVVSNGFAKLPFDSVSYNSVSNAPANGDTESGEL